MNTCSMGGGGGGVIPESGCEVGVTSMFCPGNCPGRMRMGSCPGWGFVWAHGWPWGTWMGHTDGVLPGHMDGVLPGHMDGVLP